jgi:hypothetical protein
MFHRLRLIILYAFIPYYITFSGGYIFVRKLFINKNHLFEKFDYLHCNRPTLMSPGRLPLMMISRRYFK